MSKILSPHLLPTTTSFRFQNLKKVKRWPPPEAGSTYSSLNKFLQSLNVTMRWFKSCNILSFCPNSDLRNLNMYFIHSHKQIQFLYLLKKKFLIFRQSYISCLWIIFILFFKVSLSWNLNSLIEATWISWI